MAHSLLAISNSSSSRNVLGLLLCLGLLDSLVQCAPLRQLLSPPPGAVALKEVAIFKLFPSG